MTEQSLTYTAYSNRLATHNSYAVTLDAAGNTTADSLRGLAFAYGEVEFGAQNWWQTVREAKLQEFAEWPNGAYLGHFLVRGPLGGLSTTAWGSSDFLAHQQLGAAVADGLRWDFQGRYQQQPHVFSQIARSSFLDTGNGFFLLPDSLQRANQENPGAYVNTMNSFLATAPFIPLEHRTDVKDARLRLRPSRGWQLTLAGEQRARVGTKAYGMSFGFSNTNEVTEPIDQRMNDVSFTADYQKNRVAFRGVVGYSSFDNRIDALTVDNSVIWVSYVPLLPLFVLMGTGVYMWFLPTIARRRARRAMA